MANKRDPVVSALAQAMVDKKYRRARRNATDLGHVAIEWNHLCGTLGWAFAALMLPKDTGTSLAAWGAITSDRSQRQMLAAAIHAELAQTDKVRRGMQWALDEASKIGSRRDNIIHAPYKPEEDGDGGVRLVVADLHGNRQVAYLKNRDIETEMKAVRDAALALSGYVAALTQLLLRDERAPLPQKPAAQSWRPRGSQTAISPSRSTRTKRPLPQRPSKA